MRRLTTILALLVLAAFVAIPARASAMGTTGTGMTDTSGCASMMEMSGGTGGMDGDMMDMTTIQSLRTCVTHCYDMGYIKTQGVEAALLKLLDAAQASADKGNTTAAINSLNAFITLVQKQPGTIVDSTHANCLIMHATMVIKALGG
jgi:hypothetical protein